MNKYYYNKRIQQGAGHIRLGYGTEDVVVFDDGKSYIEAFGDKGFETDVGTFEEQVGYFKRWLQQYRRRLERLEGILRACEEQVNNK
jgi:hypothetical protein